MSSQSSSAVARQIYDAFNNRQYQRALELATEDVEIHFLPTGQVFKGRQGFSQFMVGFGTAFPDGKITLTNQVEAGNAVVNEFSFVGTHTGPLAGPAGEIPPTGRKAEFRVCEVWTLRNGKLALLRNYQDLASVMRQLGLA